MHHQLRHTLMFSPNLESNNIAFKYVIRYIRDRKVSNSLTGKYFSFDLRHEQAPHNCYFHIYSLLYSMNTI